MKKLLFFLALIPLLVFVSCSDELDGSSASEKGRAPAGSGYPSYFSIMKVSNNKKTKAGVPTTTPSRSIKWDDFSVIKIYFMNGNTALINKVKTVASTYTELTNLRFKYVNSADEADVRIAFSNHEADPGLGYLAVNWSYLGKECYEAEASEPTMNLAIADINDLEEVNSPTFRASILREFGHMIGMIYEYQRSTTNPDERIVLDEEIVFGDLGFSTGEEDWFDEIDMNLKLFSLQSLIVADTILPTFDEYSIMLPYIPDHWIITTGIKKTSAVMFNKIRKKRILDLSAKDSAYIAAAYQKPVIPPPPPGSKGNITISLASLPINVEPWGISYAGWDYRIGTTGAEISEQRIIGDYPTIGIEEYEWTTLNLRLKYRGPSLNFLNYDNTMVNFLAGSAFGDNANTVNEFEKVFGTWITELSTNAYDQAISYRYDDAEFTRNDTQYPSANVAFNLPDTTAILQLFGQMPHTVGDVYKDFRNYAFGLPDDVIEANPQLATDLASAMPFLDGDYNQNLSGLSLLPIGSMDAHGLAEAPYIYEPHLAWTNSSNAFLTTGTGVKLKMKGGQRNFSFHETNVNNREIIRLNLQLWHWGSARYCRALTDEELGYRLYVDEASDMVVYLPLSEEPETGYVELPRGIKRGVALGCLYKYVPNGIYYFTKSWSKIQQEAAAIRYSSLYIH